MKYIFYISILLVLFIPADGYCKDFTGTVQARAGMGSDTIWPYNVGHDTVNIQAFLVVDSGAIFAVTITDTLYADQAYITYAEINTLIADTSQLSYISADTIDLMGNLLIQRYSSVNSAGPVIMFLKSDTDVEGVLETTDDGDDYGLLLFMGVDTASGLAFGAFISVEQNGASGETYVPADMFLSTSGDTGYNLMQLVLHNNGNIGIGVEEPLEKLHINGSCSAINFIGLFDGLDIVELQENILYDTSALYGLADTLSARLSDIDGDSITSGTVQGDFIADSFIRNYESDTIDGAFTVTGIFDCDSRLVIGAAGAFAGQFTDPGDIFAGGSVFAEQGLMGRAERFGRGLVILQYDLAARGLFTGCTFTVSNQTIACYDTATNFISSGIQVGDFLRITYSATISDSSYIGAVGEITSVDTNELMVSMAAAGIYVPSDITGLSLIVVEQPQVALLDNGDFHFNVGQSDEASFKITIDTGTSEHGVHVDATAAADGFSGMEIDIDADTHANVSAIEIQFDAGGSAEEVRSNILSITVEADGATGGELHCFDVGFGGTDYSDTLELAVIGTGRGVDIIHQVIGDDDKQDTLYTYDGVSFVDISDSCTSDTLNHPLFASDNDYLYMGTSDTFVKVNSNLVTIASSPILAIYEHSAGGGVWSAFSPSGPATEFTASGLISLPGLADWEPDTIFSGSDTIYWIRIQRTRNNLVTIPVESTIDIPTGSSDYYWNKTGDIQCRNLYADSVVVGGVGLNVPDYVFDEELMPLEEVADFIYNNGHLPTMPAAGSEEWDRVDLLQMNMRLLEEVERLYRYIIEMKEL
ncbi:hypothetical protein N9104_01770 [Pseudomonadales bacterium]|nr:hypothetical protein [Pseudomonadales bacterium]